MAVPVNGRFLKFLIYFIFVVIFLLGCENQEKGKIKLASKSSTQRDITQTTSSVLQVSPELQRSIVILFFKNETGDATLNWLRRGLTDMLMTELAQSPYINVIPMKRLKELATQINGSNADLNNLPVALGVAREAAADVILSGRFYYQEEKLGIDVDVRDVRTGVLIRRESVHGEGMEQIFSMVDDLSERVRSEIRGDSHEVQYTGVNLTEMTGSVEAFRYYSLALENMDKFLWDEAEKYLEKAVQLDTVFAAGFLRLAELKFNLGKADEGKKALQKTLKYKKKLSEVDRIRLQLLETRLKGDYEKLFPILQEAVKKLPTDIDLRLQLARFYYRELWDLDRALEEFKKVLDMDPGRKMVYNDLGYVYAFRGDFTTAIKYIDEYRRLAPDEPNPFDSKGEILMMAGRLNEAIDQYQAALDRWPNFINSAQKLSEIYLDLGNYEKASFYADKALALAPSEKAKIEFKYYRAMLLWRFGKIKQAQKIVNTLIRNDTLSVTPVIIAYEFYRDIGDTSTSDKILQETLEQFQKHFAEDTFDMKSVNSFLEFVLRTTVPPGKVILVMEKILTDLEMTEKQLYTIRSLLALMHLRIGQTQKAEFYSQKNKNLDEKYFNSEYRQSWSTLWKYVFESVTYHSPENLNFIESMLTVARREKRKNLERMLYFSRSSYYGALGNLKAVAEEYQRLGTPLEDKWRVIGPFSTKDVFGFEYAYPPEKEIDMNASYQSGGRKLKWQPATDEFYDGHVNLRYIFKKDAWVVGYGVVYVFSPEKRKVQIRLGSDEACKLWLNDKLIWQHYIKADAILDRDMVTVVLHPGYNKLLIKVTNTSFDWGYYLRITDEKGEGFPDITFHSPDETKKSFARQSD